MSKRSRSFSLGLCLVLALAAGLPARAGTAVRSVKTEAEWIAYDAAAGKVTVKVRKPGSGPEARHLVKGKPADFHVKLEGPALTRTTVSIQGVKAQPGEIAPGETVYVYWRPDETDATIRLARRIDVIGESARSYGAD